MSSTNKYPNTGLNHWVETDRPVMADFNYDNQIIENLALLSISIAFKTIPIIVKIQTTAKIVQPQNGSIGRIEHNTTGV